MKASQLQSKPDLVFFLFYSLFYRVSASLFDTKPQSRPFSFLLMRPTVMEDLWVRRSHSLSSYSSSVLAHCPKNINSSFLWLSRKQVSKDHRFQSIVLSIIGEGALSVVMSLFRKRWGLGLGFERNLSFPTRRGISILRALAWDLGSKAAKGIGSCLLSSFLLALLSSPSQCTKPSEVLRASVLSKTINPDSIPSGSGSASLRLWLTSFPFLDWAVLLLINNHTL